MFWGRLYKRPLQQHAMTTYDDQYHVSRTHRQFKAKLLHPYLVCIQDSQVSMLLAYSTFGNIFSIEEEGIGLFRTMDCHTMRCIMLFMWKLTRVHWLSNAMEVLLFIHSLNIHKTKYWSVVLSGSMDWGLSADRTQPGTAKIWAMLPGS